MQLFIIEENGDLIEVNKLDFIDEAIYLVDDDETIYIWVGNEASQNKKIITADIARRLESELDEYSKILIMKQDVYEIQKRYVMHNINDSIATKQGDLNHGKRRRYP